MNSKLVISFVLAGIISSELLLHAVASTSFPSHVISLPPHVISEVFAGPEPLANSSVIIVSGFGHA
jgi:hypothetical protein